MKEMNHYSLSQIFKDSLFTDGDWIESKDQDPQGSIRLIQLADIGEGEFLDKSSRFVNAATAEKLKVTFLKKDDILIARMPDPLGRACRFPLNEENKYITVVDVCILRVPDGMDSSFVCHMINSPIIRSEISRQSTGTTRKRISRKKLGNITIPLPPLPVQEKIASILDDAAALRDKTEQLLTEYDLLAQSLFLEMFGDPGLNPKNWSLMRMEDISQIDKKIIRPENIVNGQKYIGLDSIEKDTGEIVNVEIVEAGSIKSNKYIFTENHILYGRLRPYLNKVGNPDFSGICSTDIITLMPIKSKTNKEFLTLFLRGKWHLNWADLNTTGANLPRLNLKAFSDYEIPVPPLDLQNQFAEKIQLIERQKEIVRQELQESEDLFQALLQKAFKGELM